MMGFFFNYLSIFLNTVNRVLIVFVKLSTIILLLCICVACNVSDKITIPPFSNELDLNVAAPVTSSTIDASNSSDIPTEPVKTVFFDYTVKKGDTFFSIAASLYPDKDLSAAADTLKELNPNPIKTGDIIICPEKEDIPDYDIVTARPVGKDADKVLYAYQKDGKWGLIDGFARIVMEPTHAMVTTLGDNITSYYLVSDNKEKPFTGLLYTADGQKIFDFEVGLIGGGPECNSSHIRSDVFTYEENGKLGIVTIDQGKVSPAVFDSIRDDYHGAFMYGYKDNITGFLTLAGMVPTPDIPGLSLMGIGDDVISEYSYTRNQDTNKITVYKGKKAVFETQYRIEQIEGGFLEYTEDGVNTYDLDFNRFHSFPKEYNYLLDGSEGIYSYSGYLMFEKDGKYILCDKNGSELISMDNDKWFEAILDGEYLRISTNGSPDMLYDLDGHFVEEAENKEKDNPDNFYSTITAFYNDNSYYCKYNEWWFEFVTEDFKYTFPYSTEEYFATYSLYPTE